MGSCLLRWSQALLMAELGIHGFIYLLIYIICTCMYAKLLQSCLTLCCPLTRACQAPLSMGFSRQEYWSGLPCPPPGDLPKLGIKPVSLLSPALADRFFFFTTSTTWEAPHYIWHLCKWTFYTYALVHGHTPRMNLCHRFSPSQSV